MSSCARGRGGLAAGDAVGLLDERDGDADGSSAASRRRLQVRRAHSAARAVPEHERGDGDSASCRCARAGPCGVSISIIAAEPYDLRRAAARARASERARSRRQPVRLGAQRFHAPTREPRCAGAGCPATGCREGRAAAGRCRGAGSTGRNRSRSESPISASATWAAPLTTWRAAYSRGCSRSKRARPRRAGARLGFERDRLAAVRGDELGARDAAAPERRHRADLEVLARQHGLRARWPCVSATASPSTSSRMRSRSHSESGRPRRAVRDAGS